jgi:hypothetical protein
MQKRTTKPRETQSDASAVEEIEPEAQTERHRFHAEEIFLLSTYTSSTYG